MSRKRSINELSELHRKLIDRGANGGGELTRRATEQAARYWNNASNSKSAVAGFNRFMAANRAGDDLKASEIAKRAINRKYSPRMYKGLSNG